MKEKKPIKYACIFGISALFISLFLNIYLLTKVNELGNRIGQVMSDQQYMSNELENQTSEIMSLLDDIQQQQSWLENIDTEVILTSAGDGELRFKWLIKELAGESDVRFHYALREDEQFTSIPATERERGLFEASIPLETGMGPIWQPTEIYGVTSHVEELDDVPINEITDDLYDSTQFQYYVSVVKEDGSYKSGDIQTGYLYDFLTELYGYMETGVYLEDKVFQVYLHHYVAEGLDNVIENVSLLKYQQGKLIGEDELDRIEEGPSNSSFEKHNIDIYDDMRLVLKVVYRKGETFEREIINEE
ncbi:hypothetical protein KGF86_11155 [Ornithinibacillus massiliensis]|uniref:Uncharacterized protein n=1 Tax=Ornithinibacillus massiliensis TaxID=1944633 RepID=A0ABS5MEQ2_9BACI|nr:hypothetical protein [Ornithinibacillus massiliensis]MBS3680775.1 hypothetical protein [Ornithinibacillus massiliensis]